MATPLHSPQPAPAYRPHTEDDAIGSHKHPPAVPSRAEIRQLLEAPTDPADRLLLRLFYSTGLRRAEVVALRWCDVRESESDILVRCGKMSKDRYVCVDAETLRMLHEHRGDAAPDQSIFGLTNQQIWGIVERYGQMTGLEQHYRKQKLDETAEAVALTPGRVPIP